MVAPDHDGGFHFSRRDQLIEFQSRLHALAVAEPANARGQSLERDFLTRHLQPAMQVRVLGEQFHDGFVGGVDVFLLARKRHPAERSLALAEQRADIRGDKTWELERVGHAVVVRLLAQVVAVVEHFRARALESQHRFDVPRHRVHRHLFISFGIGFPQLVRRGDGQPRRDVHQRLMRGRLVGHHVGDDSTLREFVVHVRRVADQPDGTRRPRFDIFLDERHRLFEIVHHRVHITDGAAPLGAVFIHLDDESHTFVHGDRHGLRAAHPAEASRQHELAFERVPAFEFGERAEGFVRALQNSLRADVDPRTRGHLAVHDESLFGEFVEVFPRGPMRDEVRVGDQHFRRVAVTLEHDDGFARLHEQRFVRFEILERFEDRVERLPIARGLSAPAVDDEVLRAFRHLGVKVVLDHAICGFGEPVLAGEVSPARRADGARSRHDASPCRSDLRSPQDFASLVNKNLPAIIAGREG
ncbi:MAG: hypothetical protein PGMFKBFP_03233 [Anaerolineales bacterium]|nr:hypothetical protein [Anaerolineales bacterium]